MAQIDRGKKSGVGQRITVGLSLFGISGLLVVWVLLRAGSTPPIALPVAELPFPNAWNLYQDAAEAVTDTPPGIAQMIGTPEQYPEECKQLFAANDRTIALVQKAQDFPCQVPPAQGQKENNGLRLLSVGKIIYLWAWSKAAEGDYRAVVRGAVWLIRFGTDLTQGADLRTAQIGARLESLAYPLIIASLPALNQAQLRALSQQMEKLDRQRAPLTAILTQEKYAGQRELAQAFSRMDALEFYFSASPLRRLPRSNDLIALISAGAATLTLTKSQVLRNYNQVQEGWITWAEKPYRSTSALPPLPDDALSPVPALSPVRFRLAHYDFCRTQTRLLLTATALHAYRVVSGSYPPDLQTLVTQGYLTIVPLDPFTEAPLRYRRISAFQYRLYSVGPDGKDDGGLPLPRITPQNTVEAPRGDYTDPTRF